MSIILPTLSIRQPWAWSIIAGHKLIENRSRRTHLRGRILIHAPLTWDHEGQNFILDSFPELFDEFAGTFMPTGGIVGEAEIVDCVEASDSPWFFGPYGYVIANPKPLPFMPLKGKLGFFKTEYKEAA